MEVEHFSPAMFHNLYEPENVVFLKYPHSYIQRQQRDFLCYLQACSVVQHYAVGVATGKPAKTLDINAFVKSNVTGMALRRHLDGIGTGSKTVLRRIISPH